MNNKLNSTVVIAFVISILITGCSSPKFLSRYEKQSYIEIIDRKQNEIIVTKGLKDFLKTHTSPKLLVRVDNEIVSVINKENTDNLTKYIENAFMRIDYEIMDRSLLNEVFNSQDRYEEYKKIKEITGAELIIELQKLDYYPVVLNEKNQKLTVNKYSDGYEQTLSAPTNKACNDSYKPERVRFVPLFIFECKIILVDKGKIGGSFIIYSFPTDINNDFKYIKTEEYSLYNRMGILNNYSKCKGNIRIYNAKVTKNIPDYYIFNGYKDGSKYLSSDIDFSDDYYWRTLTNIKENAILKLTDDAIKDIVNYSIIEIGNTLKED